MAKKRANGEGSIRKKPNGRWEGRYTQGIDPNTGRAIQKSVSARTQAECKEKLAKAIRDNRGIPVNHNEDYTVAEWCRLWFETYSKPVIRPNTAKTYENMIENHIVPAIGGVKLKRLTAIQIQKMYNDSKIKGRVQRFEKKTDTALSGSTVRGQILYPGVPPDEEVYARRCGGAGDGHCRRRGVPGAGSPCGAEGRQADL